MKRFTLSLLFTVLALIILIPAALAADVVKAEKSEVDRTDANKGLVKVKYLAKSSKILKVKIEKAGAETYSYDLNQSAAYESYPLQSGNGSYTIKVLENIEGNRYSVVQTVPVNVTLVSGTAPFLNSIQSINWSSTSASTLKARELTANVKDDLTKVANIYKFVVTNVTYDTSKASKIQAGQLSGYLPVVDTILSTKKGICFDYSALMAAMLRSVGIPTKMVFGYVAPNNVYHAWNEVYIQGIGWVKINGDIYFDGKNWSRMDSTFAASNGNGKLSGFLGNGQNYSSKLVY